jgi:hypothetical protein
MPFPIFCRLKGILLVGIFILSGAVGCQQTKPLNSTPSNRPTPSVITTITLRPNHSTTPTTTTTPRNTLTATSFPLLISTPQLSLDNYHLRTWTENDSANLLNRTLNLDYSQWDQVNLDKANLTFEAERLLRFPSSPNWFTSAWETASVDPHGVPLPTMRPGQTFFSFLLEHLLNQEGVTLDQLRAALEDHSFYIDDATEVDNLFGDGHKAYVYVVKINSLQFFGEFTEVFAVHQVLGEYRVETLMDWHIDHMPSFWLVDSLHAVGDTNGNGTPEIIVDENSGWTAMTGNQLDTENLNIFEWQSTQRDFSVYNFFVDNRGCGDPPICKYRWEWEFGPVDESGTRPLIVTRYTIEQSNATGQPAQVTTHTWSEISQYLVTPNSATNSELDEIEFAEQIIEQLLFQKQDYPATIVHIVELLAKLPPVAADEPDYHRPYLHYLLGISYELNTQPQEAEETYYNLWFNYPSNIFGAAASAKLEVNK